MTRVDTRPVSPGGFRPYRTCVASRRELSPTFVRLVLTGEDLDLFGTDGLDQRIKLLFADERGRFVDLGIDDPEAMAAGDWYRRWLAAPVDRRNPMRTYTVRSVDPAHRELTIDFAVHGVTGPGSSFAATARPGDELVVVGPDSRSPQSAIGIDFRPGAAHRILLAGDETAVPAIGAILERLASRADGVRVQAFLEVPDGADVLDLSLGDGIEATWMMRGGTHGRCLVDAVSAFCLTHPEFLGARPASASPLEDVDIDATLLWEVPDDDTRADFYAWVAGEAGTVKALRRMLVQDRGIDRKQVAFMGYWRRGRAEMN